MLKTIKILTVVSLLGSGVLYANSVRDVLSQQVKFSHNVLKAYKKHKSKHLLTQIYSMKKANLQLKNSVRDPEIKNLLVFLDICYDELRVTVRKPYSRDNAQLISDLSISINEGTHYVKRALKI
jgi:hypothetical protein